MTCRHEPGDPNCSSSPEGQERMRQEAARRREQKAQKRVDELLARTPNPDEYEILRVEEVDGHLVMEVQYSSCTKCSFDAKKVMVFLNTTMKDVVFWKRIDPHFEEVDPDDPTSKHHAPPPRARFPADEDGWWDAMEYAKSKTKREIERQQSRGGTVMDF